MDKLYVGEYASDWHDGVAGAERKGFAVVSVTRWPDHGHEFAEYLKRLRQNRQVGDLTYLNKMLVVLSPDFSAGETRYVCGYAYDNREAGVVVLQVKEER